MKKPLIDIITGLCWKMLKLRDDKLALFINTTTTATTSKYKNKQNRKKDGREK